MGKTTLGKTVTTTEPRDDNGWRMWLTCILILLSFTCCIIKMNELAVHVRDGLRILGVLHSTHTTMIKNIHTGQLYHEQQIWEHTMNLTTMETTIHGMNTNLSNVNATMSNINTNLSNVNTSMNNDLSIANNAIVALKHGRIADKEEIKQLRTENRAIKLQLDEFKKDVEKNMTALLNNLTTSIARLGCETDWELYEGLCYKFVVCPNSVCTGDAAKAECNSFGGQLARVKSGGHHNLFVSKLSGKHFWLGGNDRDTEGQWVWENGIHMVDGWTNWYNVGAGGPVDEPLDCLYSNYNWAGNKWDDFPCCNELHAYVCEKPPTF